MITRTHLASHLAMVAKADDGEGLGKPSKSGAVDLTLMKKLAKKQPMEKI